MPHLGNACCSSATPASVTCLGRKSACRLVNPLRCTSPASVTLVSLWLTHTGGTAVARATVNRSQTLVDFDGVRGIACC